MQSVSPQDLKSSFRSIQHENPLSYLFDSVVPHVPSVSGDGCLGILRVIGINDSELRPLADKPCALPAASSTR
jgi:hypothetical protein